jgi:hypothetical protein
MGECGWMWDKKCPPYRKTQRIIRRDCCFLTFPQINGYAAFLAKPCKSQKVDFGLACNGFTTFREKHEDTTCQFFRY